MAEYIERGRLIDDLTLLAKYQTGERQQGILGVIGAIRLRKAADVEPVVRCKDCAVWSPPLEGTSSLTQMGQCEYTGYAAEADDYCSFADFICGERNNDETAILKQALDTYGAEAQTLMVMEEMSELQKELCKHARGADNRENIAEEIADVLIMLDQMMLLYSCKESVERYRDEKIKRLAERLREERK